MSFKLLGGGSDLATVVSDVNQNILELKGRELTEIFKDDSGTRRVLLGKGADGFYGLKVSPEGTDVYTATDDELVFNSNQNVFKILSSGSVTLSKGTNTVDAQLDVPHNLDFIPAAIVYHADATNPSQLFALPYSYIWPSGSEAGKIGAILYYYMTATDIHLAVRAPNYAGNTYYSSAFTFNFKYYLLQESAN